jgi:CHAT domain-containing protein/tetratricopeptide (TPR) repeat protein
VVDNDHLAALLAEVEQLLEHPDGRARARELLHTVQGPAAESDLRFRMLRGRAAERGDGERDLRAAWNAADASVDVRAWAAASLAHRCLISGRPRDAAAWLGQARKAMFRRDGASRWASSVRFHCHLVEAQLAEDQGVREAAEIAWKEAIEQAVSLGMVEFAALCIVGRARFRAGAEAPPQVWLEDSLAAGIQAGLTGPVAAQLASHLTHAVSRGQAGTASAYARLLPLLTPSSMPIEDRLTAFEVCTAAGNFEGPRRLVAVGEASSGLDDEVRETLALYELWLDVLEERPGARDALLAFAGGQSHSEAQAPTAVRAELAGMLVKLDEHDAALAVLATLDDSVAQVHRVSARLNRTAALMLVGRVTEAEAELDQADASTVQQHPRLLLGYCMARGALDLHKGAYEQAREFYRQSLPSIGHVLGPDEEFEAIRGYLSATEVLGLDTPEELGSIRAKLESLQERVAPHMRAHVSLTIATILRLMGQTRAAYSRLLRIVQEGLDTHGRVWTLSSIAELEPEPERALRFAREALNAARDNTSLQAIAKRAIASAHQGLHDPVAAEAAWIEAADLHQGCGELVGLATALLAIGDLRAESPSATAWYRRAMLPLLIIDAFTFDKQLARRCRERVRRAGHKLVFSSLKHEGTEVALGEVIGLRAAPTLRFAGSAARRRRSVPQLLLDTLAVASTPRGNQMLEARPVAQRDRIDPPPVVLTAEEGLQRLMRDLRSGLRAEAWVDGTDLRALIPPQVACVEYLLTSSTDGQLLAFVVQREGITVHRKTWRAEHMAAHRCVREQIMVPGGGKDVQALMEALQVLSDVLLEPLGSLPDEVSDLILAPGGLLSDVPFAALPSHTGRALWDRTRLSFLPSLGWLPRLMRPRSAIRTALVLRGENAGGNRRLDGADREVQLVRSLLSEAGVDLVQATQRDELLELDYLHYAGHASFTPDAPDTSTILLPGGALSADVLASLPLQRGPVVTLAGCATGRSDPDVDEATGFVRAFLVAGARGVVASSWPIPDRVTADLAAALVSGLCRGMHAAEVLRRIMLTVRTRDPSFAHPHVWASLRWWGAPPGLPETPVR